MSPRFWLSRLHRWAGLLLALLLGLSGLSGGLLVWEQELDTFLNPTLLRVKHNEQPCLPPLTLRERVQAQYPDAHLNQVDLNCQPRRSVRFWLKPAVGSTLANDQVFINPYSGAITGARHWGNLSQGIRLNLIPFIYRLHSELLLGKTGKTLLGITALLWIVLTVSGVWLSVPRHQQQRWRRWLQAWRLPWHPQSSAFLFRWHRGLGLWFAGLFLVFAWSGVGFTLKQPVYQPVMSSLFGLQAGDRDIPTLATPQPHPGLEWEQALTLARMHMNQAMAAARGFKVAREFRLAYDPKRAVFHYRVTSSLDARHRGETALWLDGNSGAPVAWFLPSGEARGDSIGTWLKALHMAETGGITYRIVASLTGLVVFLLALTGIWSWGKRNKKLTFINAPI